ncbi:glycosyltransferase family 4 protein [Coleofasciculus sp. H7-2]|uniref:glycosyltransferase family 4 protein n=1 Tax=Coleofasciculus sp. H7-2 TaxID=3351545 RepID=UPI003671B475
MDFQQDKKLKISLVVSDLSVSGAGRWGGAVRTFLLYEALTKLNHEVKIFGFVFGDESPEVSQSKIPIVAIPCAYHSGFIKAAQKLLKQIDGDIIYAVKLKPTSFGLSIIKKLTARRPVILDIDDWELSWHGGEQWKYRPSLKQFYRDTLKPDGALRYPDHPLYLKWLESLVSYADTITLHTQFLKERFGGVYLPNGKDTTLFDPSQFDSEASRIRYGLAGYRILMFPGAPRPYKGLEDVLAALDVLNQPDLRLVIVGGSPYDAYDNQLMQQWERWIIKLPKYPVSEMPAVVAAAHIVVVPQRDTPAAQAQFPLKLTDGMAMAKPILSTYVGDIPEILGGTGYLVTPESPEEIAEKIQWIFEHLDEANQQGMKARERCINHYSTDTMAAILSDVIKDLQLAGKV